MAFGPRMGVEPMSHYEIKISLIVSSDCDNTATVQRALVDYLNYMQRHKALLTTTEDDDAVAFHSWDPIRD